MSPESLTIRRLSPTCCIRLINGKIENSSPIFTIIIEFLDFFFGKIWDYCPDILFLLVFLRRWGFCALATPSLQLRSLFSTHPSNPSDQVQGTCPNMSEDRLQFYLWDYVFLRTSSTESLQKVYRQLGDSNSQSQKCFLKNEPVGGCARWGICQLGDVLVGECVHWGRMFKVMWARFPAPSLLLKRVRKYWKYHTTGKIYK